MLNVNSDGLISRSAPKLSHNRLESSMFADMPMRTIVFSSQKGGSGKTTLCGQLAVQAERMGLGPVAVIDTDPQGSLSEWWNARQDKTPLFLKTQVKYLMSDLEELRNRGIKLVFVDTPPAVTDIIEEIVSYADLVVVPTRPSPHDLRAVGATLDIIEAQGKPLVFVVNGATPEVQITSDTAVALSQHGTVAPETIHQHPDFATSMIDGRTVMETQPDSKSAAEIGKLWQYLSTRLIKMERERQKNHIAEMRGQSSGAGNENHFRTGFGRRSTDTGYSIEEAV